MKIKIGIVLDVSNAEVEAYYNDPSNDAEHYYTDQVLFIDYLGGEVGRLIDSDPHPIEHATKNIIDGNGNTIGTVEVRRLED